MTWHDATLESLVRMSLRHRRNYFTRTEIIEEELWKIAEVVQTAGKTPAQTLSRVLQDLRDEGYLEFDGHGGYTLIGSAFTPTEADLPDDYVWPNRAPTTVHRVIRNTGIVSELKRLYGYRCQVCTTRLELSSGFYCEAHHLKPLGTPHDGPDAKPNMLIVCPNHHVLLDYRALKIHSGSLKLERHLLDQDFVDYHNREICG